jgi:hypothetical protein
MVPAVFSVLEKLPLSPTGKIDRRALAQLPVTLETGAEDAPAALLGPLEQLLVAVWNDVLNLTHAGLDDDFFAIGGNSLKSMALTHQLQRKLNRTVRPQVLMQAPTIAQLAAWLRDTFPGIEAELAAPAAEPDAVEEGEI